MPLLTFPVLIYIAFAYFANAISTQNDGSPMDTQYEELSNILNNFGYKLTVQILKESNETNVVTSPIGITGLLAMALLGSVGKSYDELSDKLGFSQDILSNRKYHEKLGELLKKLNDDDTYSKTLYADAIFVQKNYKLREVYRSYLNKVYNGEALSIDFTDGAAAKSEINGWVRDHTNGKLPALLKENLPLHTKIALLSALYFIGQWKTPFVPEFTRKLPFTKLSSNEIMVDQMLNVGKFKYGYSQDDGFDVLALPYNDSVTTMYVVKPKFPKNMNIIDLMNSIDYVKISNLIDQMKKEECVIRFPKMELQNDVKLEIILKDLGIKSIFSPEEANFALMIDINSTSSKTEDDLIQRFNDGDNNNESQIKNVINSLPNPGLYVDTALHSVKMKIDEYGTEASAATGLFMARTAQLFYLNSPFYMFIRNEKTNLVTFSAVILNPNA